MSEQERILIADDDLFLRTTKTVLEREGYVCCCTTKGSNVADLVVRDTYDLLIANVRMFGSVQLEWIPLVQRRTANMPIILVTEFPCVESTMRAIQLQVAAYLVKPFEAQLLLTRVRNAIARGHAAKIARKIQKRWQERAVEVQEVAASEPSATWTSDLSIELLLAMVLDDLSQSFSIIQDLRALLDYRGGKPLASSVLCPPSYPTTEGYPQPDNAKSLMPLQLRKQEEHSQEKTHLAQVLAQIQQLSRREREVLRLLLINKKPKTIAGTLFISAYTVRNHLRSIFDKFSVHSQTELLTVLGKSLTYTDLQGVI